MADILCIFIIFLSLKKRQYRYIAVAMLCMCYFIVSTAFANSSLYLYSNYFRVIEITILLALLSSVFYACIKVDSSGKKKFTEVYLCVVVFLARILRSCVYSWQINQMKQPSANVIEIQEQLFLIHSGITTAINLLLCIMLVSIVIRLSKKKRNTKNI